MSTTATDFGVLIRSVPHIAGHDRWYEVLITKYSGTTTKVYLRTTESGGRGPSNAWRELPGGAVPPAPRSVALAHDPVVVELSALDIDALNTGGRIASLTTRLLARATGMSLSPGNAGLNVGQIVDVYTDPAVGAATVTPVGATSHAVPGLTPEPAPEPEPEVVAVAEPEPEPEPEPEEVPEYEGVYLALKKGVVTLPNGVEYHARNIEGVSDVDLTRRLRRTSQPIFLRGVPGTGKTKLLEAAFNPDHMESMVCTANTDVSDFIGGFIQRVAADGTKTYPWVDGPLTRAMERGVPFFVDEIGLADPKELSVLYSVMDGRDELVITANPERGVVKAAEGFYVCAATNPDAPGVRLSEALLSRFAVHIEVTTDYKMAGRLGVDDRIVTAAHNLDTKRLNGEVSWAPQMRELLATRKLLAAFGEKITVRNLVSIAPVTDREVVADVLSKTFGWKVGELASE